MKLVEMSAKMVQCTQDAEKFIEYCGRKAYKSEDLISENSAAKFIQMLIKRGHESVLEHATASFEITCDRGISHEIVRHRIASYTQESTRYCSYNKAKFGNEITVVAPFERGSMEFDEWMHAMNVAELTYLDLITRGQSPQMARSVLPNSLKTELIMTTNFRSWRNFLRLRTSSSAHPQIRPLAQQIGKQLRLVAPNVFGDLNE